MKVYLHKHNYITDNKQLLSRMLSNEYSFYNFHIDWIHLFNTHKVSLLITLFIRQNIVIILTLLVQGGTMCLRFFKMAFSPWKKVSGGTKFLDFSQFIINIQNIIFFHSVLGWYRRCGHIMPPNSRYIQKPRTIRIKHMCV